MAVFKLHIPMLDRIKQDGFKNAMLFYADQTVTRITAGLGIADIRSALRGDPPPRPNPRTKPHAEGFWMHMRPTYYHNKVMTIYPTFRLGWLSVYFIVFETITGIILMLWYTPSPLLAYDNMLNILSNVPLGKFMRDLHRLGAEAMVAVVSLHMLRTFLTGSYKKPRQFTWLTGMVLLGVTLVLSFSGYLLPWDQLALWAVTIGASMAEATPFIGREVDTFVRGGPEMGANGLLRFYLLHVLALPALLFIFTGVHYYKVIIHGHSLPPAAEAVGEDTARKVPMDQRSYFIPDVMTREVFLTVVVTALLVVGVTIVGYQAPLEPHANPLVTPVHSVAPWYFLWLQGMLKLGDKLFWGLVVPPLLIGLLVVLPYIELGPSRRYADRRVGLTAAAASLAVLSILTFMGTPWYGVTSSGDQEVLFEMLPQTHPGPVREAGYENLPVGVYSTDDTDVPNIHVEHLLEEMETVIGRYSSRLVDAEGLITVEQWQADLRKVTITVNWVEDGEERTASEFTFVHEETEY